MLQRNQFTTRCETRLREMDYPVSGWRCSCVVDLKEDLGYRKGEYEVCELCGKNGIRFLHRMVHTDKLLVLDVGCECACALENDGLAAECRERKARSRANRRKRILSRKWKKDADLDVLTARHRGKRIFIKEPVISPTVGDEGEDRYYKVWVDGEEVSDFRGIPLSNFKLAVYAAFEKSDPIDY